MTYKATGFIIGKRVSRECDRIFVLYTEEYGKIEALAQGVLKLSSKLGGNLELLTKASFLLARGKVHNRIASIDTLHTFRDTKKNLVKLALALTSAEMLHQLVQWNTRDKGIYELYEDFLQELEKLPSETKTKQALGFLHLFTVKISILLGYRPQSRSAKQFLDRLTTDSLGSFLSEQIPSSIKTFSNHFLSENLTKQLKGNAYLDLIGENTLQ